VVWRLCPDLVGWVQAGLDEWGGRDLEMTWYRPNWLVINANVLVD
jgi:hypothetical protein